MAPHDLQPAGTAGKRRTCYNPQSHQTCSEKATQRPTEKTAGPGHPFFIGSRPEPVFRGGISPSLFGSPQNRDPWGLASENAPGESAGKSKLVVSRCYTVAGNRRTPGQGWHSLLGGGRILQQAVTDRVPLPPGSYGVSASLKRRRRAGPGRAGRRKPEARRVQVVRPPRESVRRARPSPRRPVPERQAPPTRRRRRTG